MYVDQVKDRVKEGERETKGDIREKGERETKGDMRDMKGETQEI